MAKWEAEFSQLMNAQREELEDYGTSMQKAWEGGVGDYNGASQGIKFDGEGIPILGDYPFGMINVLLPSPFTHRFEPQKKITNTSSHLRPLVHTFPMPSNSSNVTALFPKLP